MASAGYCVARWPVIPPLLGVLWWLWKRWLIMLLHGQLSPTVRRVCVCVALIWSTNLNIVCGCVNVWNTGCLHSLHYQLCHKFQSVSKFLTCCHCTFQWDTCVRCLSVTYKCTCIACLYPSVPRFQDSLHHRHFHCLLQAWLLQLCLSQPAEVSVLWSYDLMVLYKCIYYYYYY